MSRLIPEKESLTVEFKSDRKRLSDRDVVEAAVCLANTEGGDIYLGIEKDGTPTGLHAEHRNLTGLAALIANKTNPPISVRVESVISNGITMIVLARLRGERRLDTSELASAIQKNESAARAVMERLIETGLVEAHGVKKGRTYMLSANVYRRIGQPNGYVRQAGFDSIQQEQMVLQYIRNHGQITRKDVIKLCRMGPFQATRLLNKLVTTDNLQLKGKGRGSYYEIAKNNK